MSAGTVPPAGWAAALAGSLLLHAGAAAALLPLLDAAGAKPAPTAISFSDPPPDIVASLAPRSETLSAVPPAPEALSAVAAGRVEPAANPAAPVLPAVSANGAALASSAAPEPARPATVAAAVSVPAPETQSAALAAQTVEPVAPQTVAGNEAAGNLEPLAAGRAEAVGASASASPVPAAALAAAAALAVQAPVLSGAPLSVSPAPSAAQLALALPLAPAAQSLASQTEPAPSLPSLLSQDTAAALSSGAILEQDPASETVPAGAPTGEGLQPLPASPIAAAAAGSSEIPQVAAVAAAPVVSLAPVAAPGAPSASVPGGSAALAPVNQAPEVLASAAQSAVALPSLADAAADRRAAVRRQAVTLAKGFNGGDCFAVVPTAAESDTPQFDAFSRDGGSMRRFADAARALGPNAQTSLSNLSAAQCSAPVFARSLPNYPDFSLALRLEAGRIPDHAFLAGRIGGAGARPLQLLLVDDEGTVQTLKRFLSAGDEPSFRIPVNLTAGKVQTRQLLIALAADRPLRLLEGDVDEDAPVFFRQLRAEIELSGAKVDLALQAFDVEAADAAGEGKR